MLFGTHPKEHSINFQRLISSFWFKCLKCRYIRCTFLNTEAYNVHFMHIIGSKNDKKRQRKYSNKNQ